MTYVLEHRAEFGRLEKQSTLEAYDYISELNDVIIQQGVSILEPVMNFEP